MLTSSDAKWRCLWHLLVWSINLSLVAQFLSISSHVVFYIIAAISVLILPVLTALYSNTSGRHGAGLLRAGYVFCDPVLACITVTPSLLLNHLPGLVNEYSCLRHHTSWNSTLECVLNHSDIDAHNWYTEHAAADTEVQRQMLIINKRQRYLIIEAAIVIPILLAFMMCKRTRKMRYSTFLVSCAYWLVMAVEAVDLLENIVLFETIDAHKHIIYTTEAMISIVSILAASYAIITLISYLSPVTPGSERENLGTETENDKFDFLYRAFVGTVSVLFCEVPLIVARCRIMATDDRHILAGTFYVWFIKDVVFVPIILVMIYGKRFGGKYLHLPCRSYDGDTTFQFEPEKRDRYIHQHQKDVVSIDRETKKFTRKKKTETDGAVPKSLLKKTDAQLKAYKALKAQKAQKTHKADVFDVSGRNQGAKKSKPPVLKSVDVKSLNANGAEMVTLGNKPSDPVSIPQKSSLLDTSELLNDASPRKRKYSPEPSPRGLLPSSHFLSSTASASETSPKKRHSPKLPAESALSPKSALSSKSSKSSLAPKSKLSSKSSLSAYWSSSSDSEDDNYLRPQRKKPHSGFSDDESPNASLDALKKGDLDHESQDDLEDNEEEGKKEKRVMFQFDIGEGLAITVKSRSDSPGVILQKTESEDGEQERDVGQGDGKVLN